VSTNCVNLISAAVPFILFKKTLSKNLPAYLRIPLYFAVYSNYQEFKKNIAARSEE